jgi:hypothetical protein
MAARKLLLRLNARQQAEVQISHWVLYLRAVEVIAHELERGGDDKHARRRRVNAQGARVHATVVGRAAAERATGRVLQEQHVAHARVAV